MSYIRVDLPNTNNNWVGFGLANVDTFIIRVGFELANIDTFRILTRHKHDSLTRITTPKLECQPSRMTIGKNSLVIISYDIFCY